METFNLNKCINCSGLEKQVEELKDMQSFYKAELEHAKEQLATEKLQHEIATKEFGKLTKEWHEKVQAYEAMVKFMGKERP